jgi:uncharacterized Tic20 family protein
MESQEQMPARRKRSGFYIGPVRVTLPLFLTFVIMVGSLAFILWDVRSSRDDQIPLLGLGFTALGVSFTALAIIALVGMWRAASRARGGRAFVLALIGGIAGLTAIGCYTITAVTMLAWTT